MHGYTPNAGRADTREVVADMLTRKYGIKFTTGEVTMTVGASGALNVMLRTVLDPGDEVVTPSPYFTEYPFYIGVHNGVCRLATTDDDFNLSIANIESQMNNRTKAVLINNPHNPTGRVYTEDTIRQLADMLRGCKRKFGHAIYLVSDEPYRDIIYDGVKVPSIFRLYEDSIVATSYSKSLAIPGERIGYMALCPYAESNKELQAGFAFHNRILGYVNAPVLMQFLVEEMERQQKVSVDVSEYLKRRDILYGELSRMGYQIVKPDGTFYMFPKSPTPNDMEFTDNLLEKLVLVVPGRGFGTPGYFRISYCNAKTENLGRALDRFEDAIRPYT
jgi:aspartate aminotransferase